MEAFVRRSWQRTSLPIVALIICLPLLVVVSSFFMGVFSPEQRAILIHLTDTVIGEYFKHSLILMLGVGFLVLVIGVTSAWLTTTYNFVGKSWLRWALLLPLAMPAYITAYAYNGLLNYEGIVQSSLRSLMGWQLGDYYFPEIRSMAGSILVMGLVLFPYVYLLARSAFLEQSRTAMEASRTLGLNTWQSFYRVALPMARPAIATGVTLALMETLADYGTVQYYGVTTFTTGIFRTWYGMNDTVAALQLASILLSAVVLLMLLERTLRKGSRYHNAGRSQSPSQPITLTGFKSWLVFLLCFLPVLLGFILPALQLIAWSFKRFDIWLDAQFWQLVSNSLTLAALAAVVTVLIALWLVYGKRMASKHKNKLPSRITRASVSMASLGYAIPGVVIAVGVMVSLSTFERVIIDVSQWLFGLHPGLIFSGTLVALLFAYLVRFLSIAIQTLDSGLSQISHSMDESGRVLGLNPRQLLLKIHVPLLRTSVLTAAILVFVDVLKELPATLVLRPFNFNTLAVRAFEVASDERLTDLGPAALMIVLAGLIPVILLSRAMNSGKRDSC